MEAEKGEKDNPSVMLSRLRPREKADLVVIPISVRIGSDRFDPKTGINESLKMQKPESQCAEQHDLYKQHLHNMYIEVIHRRFSH
jgi:hypothetical protein